MAQASTVINMAQWTTPPFKGKGVAQQRLSALEEELDSIRIDMKQMCDSFKSDFPRGAPAHPTLQCVHGKYYLRWRASTPGKGYQSFFKLSDDDNDNSERVRQLIRSITKNAFIEIERLMLALNYHYSIRYHEASLIRHYLSDTASLNRIL